MTVLQGQPWPRSVVDGDDAFARLCAVMNWLRDGQVTNILDPSVFDSETAYQRNPRWSDLIHRVH